MVRAEGDRARRLELLQEQLLLSEDAGVVLLLERARNIFDLYIEQKVQRLNEQPIVAWMIRLRPSLGGG